MADTRVKIVDIQVRYQEAVEAMAKFRASLAEARKYQKDLNKELADGKITREDYDRSMAASEVFIRQQGDAMRTLSKQVNNQVKSQQEQEGSLKQLRAELSNATSAYDAMSRAERQSATGQELRDKINNITTELKAAEEETQRFYRNVGNYKSATEGLDSIKVKIMDIGKSMMTAISGGGLLAFSNKVKQVGSDYADQMAKVQSVTNANAVEFAQMSKEVEHLGSTTRYTAQEAAQAMEFLTRNGLNAITATGTLSSVLHLAQANAIELAEAADIVTGQMNAFHLSVKDTIRINDVLSYTCANSATDILQLNEALRNTAPIAYTAGVNIEETCAALGTLADNNIKGAEAGTILKQAFNGIITSTNKSKKAYKELGVSMDSSTVKADGFIGSLKKIMDAGPSVQQLSDIFGRKAVPGVLALTNSMDLLGNKFQSISENAAGTADRMFEQAYSKFTIAIDSMKSAWEGLLIQIWQGTDQELRDRFIKEGEEIDDQFIPRIDALKTKLAQLNAQFASNQNNDALLEEINSTTKALGTVSREYGLSKQLLSQQMEVEQTGNQALVDKWKQGAQAIDKEYAPKIAMVKSEIASLSEQLEADPTNEKIKAELDAKEETLKEGIQVYSSARQDFQDSMTDEIENETGKNGMAGMLQEPIEQLTDAIDFIKANINEVGRFIMTLIASISFLKLVNHAKSSFATIRNSAVQKAEEASTTVRTLQNQELTLRKTIATQTVALEKSTGTERMMLEAKLLANKREIAETEKALVRARTNEIKVWEQAAALNSGNAWKSAMSAASVATKGFFTTAKTMARTFILTALFQLAFDALYGLINLMSDATKGDGVFAKLTSSVTGFIKQGLNWLIQQFKTVVAWIQNFIENSRFAQVGLAAFKTELQVVGAVFKAVWVIFKTGLKQMWNMFKSLISIIGGVATALEGLFSLNFDNVKKGIKQVGNAVLDFGKDTVNNTKDMAGEIKDSVKDAAKGISDAFSSASNSKAFGGKGTSTTKQANRPKPVATEPVAEEEESSNNKGNSGTKRKGEKKNDNIKKKAELERKALEEAEQAMLDLMKDTAAKRRAQLETQYDDEIRKLKVRLATEKNLTETAKEAIRKTILLKEQKKNEELAKLDEEELKRDIENKQKLIDSRLAIAKKGSESEMRLKQQKNDEQLKLDEMALKEEQDTAIEDARQRLAQAIAAHGEESEEATQARLRLLQIETDYQDRMDNMQEEHRQKNLVLEQQYQQQLLNLRQQEYQNQITQFEAWNAEQQLVEQQDQWDAAERQLGMEQLKLDVVTDNEFAILAVKQQAAQESYEAIVALGQLEGETIQSFNTRVKNAEKEKYETSLAYQNAEIKNKKAYLTSMRSVTNSLVSLTSAIGESDENFAKLSKIITLAQIAIDTGRALSAGIASAASLPFPANMAAIATTVATVLANIATAISTVKSAKFAEGGKVSGPGTGTSDSIPAQLSNGEYIMTAKATKLFEPLLAAMNAIGAGVVPLQVSNAYRDFNIPTEELRSSFVEAANNIRPVVSVVEINEVQKQVEVIESLDNL